MALEKITVDKIAELHPLRREEVTRLLEKAECQIDSSLKLRVVQGLRSIEYQNDLFNQPWDKKDNDGDGKVDEADEKVTNAKGGSSMHNYGLAIDLCWLVLKDGKYVYDQVKSWQFGPQYDKVVKIFKDAGWTWGGDFTSIKDKPHFEKTNGLTWRQLHRKYLEKDFIPGTKYVKIP